MHCAKLLTLFILDFARR